MSKAAEPRPVDESVPAAIRIALADFLGVDEAEVTRDSRLVEDLHADSLDIVELAMEFEQNYGIELADEVLDTWGAAEGGTVQTLVDTLKKAGAKL